MTVLVFTALVALAAFAAGLLGALTGLGGGVVIVPLLTLVFGVDFHYAAGASLVSVIATSSGAASTYVREGYSNVRIGMLLEVATTFGALGGAYLVGLVPGSTLSVLFGVVLLVSAYLSARHPEPDRPETGGPDPLAARLRLDGAYPTPDGFLAYHVRRVPAGFGMMFGAGLLSGLLGIGSGAVKVLAMDRVMQIPFKVSTTTSNFMIGVTAAASVGVYLGRGYIDPGLAMPVTLGVLLGASLGSHVLMGARTETLRRVFAAVIFLLGLQMIARGLHLTEAL